MDHTSGSYSRPVRRVLTRHRYRSLDYANNRSSDLFRISTQTTSDSTRHLSVNDFSKVRTPNVGN
ncbi:hypothetical protein J6590_047493 [Homalodisca vitripennis]|nr:hypothetical protein J6590_047493 [Homalodisca vitripennis]